MAASLGRPCTAAAHQRPAPAAPLRPPLPPPAPGLGPASAAACCSGPAAAPVRMRSMAGNADVKRAFAPASLQMMPTGLWPAMRSRTWLTCEQQQARGQSHNVSKLADSGTRVAHLAHGCSQKKPPVVLQALHTSRMQQQQRQSTSRRASCSTRGTCRHMLPGFGMVSPSGQRHQLPADRLLLLLLHCCQRPHCLLCRRRPRLRLPPAGPAHGAPAATPQAAPPGTPA
ncbi:hypothetical protein COO60DRAFT_1151598 [Scenedesmus sp. NREL 46B-D3]|nr:hypothetical protein COO60DRAFT_1151598 [Scenedesmus sp. NREL 46B-D3]